MKDYGAIERIARGIIEIGQKMAKMRPVLVERPIKTGARNRPEWCLKEFRVGGKYDDETGEKVGGFIVRAELRDFGSECPPPIPGTWADRLLHKAHLILPLERLFFLSCHTTDGFYVGDLDSALGIYGRWKLTDVQPLPGGTVCSIGFDQKKNEWVGWSHRAAASYGIGYVAMEGGCEAVPVGFEVKTLEDAKRCAIAFAESVG